MADQRHYRTNTPRACRFGAAPRATGAETTRGRARHAMTAVQSATNGGATASPVYKHASSEGREAPAETEGGVRDRRCSDCRRRRPAQRRRSTLTSPRRAVAEKCSVKAEGSQRDARPARTIRNAFEQANAGKRKRARRHKAPRRVFCSALAFAGTTACERHLFGVASREARRMLSRGGLPEWGPSTCTAFARV